MPKVGRNDPCPCGSGKKYKNCCIRQDRVRASRELGLSHADAFLLNNLYEYGRQPRFARDLSEAFALYWGGVYDLKGLSEISAHDLRRTFEWFAHDYETSADGRHVIDIFMETQATDYPPEARERLEAWSRSVTGLFRVLRSANERVELYDCLRQSHLEVGDAALSRNVQAGDVLIGRLYQLGGLPHLSPLTTILPEAYELGLVRYVTNAYERYVADHYQAGWDRFLRETGYIFNACLLSAQADALRSLIGPGTRFHDPAIARDKLREFTAHSREEQQRQSREAAEGGPRVPHRGEVRVHRTPAGIILPGAEPKEKPSGEPEEETPSRPRILVPGRDR